MKTIEKALNRFKELVNSLECECDSYNGFTCPLHNDIILAGEALNKFKKQGDIMKGSVKIMLSYDYCHFEICLSSDENMSLDQIDCMRKDCQRLADKAVHQYKVAKREAANMCYGNKRQELERNVKIIKENYPQSEWTPEQKAIVKALDDFEYYDYQDGWNEDNYY